MPHSSDVHTLTELWLEELELWLELDVVDVTQAPPRHGLPQLSKQLAKHVVGWHATVVVVDDAPPHAPPEQALPQLSKQLPKHSTNEHGVVEVPLDWLIDTTDCELCVGVAELLLLLVDVELDALALCDSVVPELFELSFVLDECSTELVLVELPEVEVLELDDELPLTHLPVLVSHCGVLPAHTVALLQVPSGRQSGCEQLSGGPQSPSAVHATHPPLVHFCEFGHAAPALHVQTPFAHSSVLPVHWLLLVQLVHPFALQTSPAPQAGLEWQVHCPETQPSAFEPQSESAQQ